MIARVRTFSTTVAAVLLVLGAAAPAGAAAPRFLVFVALDRSSNVAILAGPPWRLLRRVSVPSGPHNAGSSPDGRSVAVTSPGANEITFFDADSRKLRSVRVDGSPHDLVYSGNGRALWATVEQGHRLVELAVPSGRLLRSVATLGRPHDLDLRPGGRELWVTIDGSSDVEVRSAFDGTLLRRGAFGGAPHDVAFEPDGRTVWFSNWSSGALTVARPTGELLGTSAAGREPHHFAFGLGLLWASDNQAGTLVRIDPRTRRVLGRTRVGPSPHHPVTAGGDVLVAVHGNGRVAVLSRAGRLLASIPVGPGPHGLAAVASPSR